MAVSLAMRVRPSYSQRAAPARVTKEVHAIAPRQGLWSPDLFGYGNDPEVADPGRSRARRNHPRANDLGPRADAPTPECRARVLKYRRSEWDMNKWSCRFLL